MYPVYRPTGCRAHLVCPSFPYLPPQSGVMELAMRRLLQIAFLIVAAGFSTGAGQAPPPRQIEFSDADRADLDRISAYLNSIHTLQGDFVQISPNGQIDRGRFYLQRPGKLRFDYDPPSPMLVVSDGRWVAVSNSKLNTFNRYPLSALPLDMILGENVDWRRDNAVMRVTHRPGMLVVEARTSRNRGKPNIAITFSEPNLELRQWTVIDDQGLPTTVALRNLQTNVPLDGSLFVIHENKKPVGVKQRD
jgi:outer membrane lipoprotein-sorting protein